MGLKDFYLKNEPLILNILSWGGRIALVIYLIGIPNLWWVEDQPYYCGQKEFLFKNLSKMGDNNLLFCYVNCGRDHGCNLTYNGGTWYDNDTMKCYCGGNVVIDFDQSNYNNYGMGGEDVWENINISAIPAE